MGVRPAQPMDVMQYALLPAMAAPAAVAWPPDRLVAYLAFPLLSGLLAPARTAAPDAVVTPAATAVTPAIAAQARAASAARAAAGVSVGPLTSSRGLPSIGGQQQFAQQQEAWLIDKLSKCAAVVTSQGNVRISNASSGNRPAAGGTASRLR